ncbi:uracil-DNA glycosylase [Rhodothermus profundi]|uniref:Type-4 uracil-DNA glycosylase n=1 Tax=Rhodothermus profundi TaxID=633813 RepID=A0A1M6W4V7_9BACT|nr:uracil-DNA glycosylase [Rhodothermus profundi]SHK88525.1 DNA polymerase [Rhodothermus profundi]
MMQEVLLAIREALRQERALLGPLGFWKIPTAMSASTSTPASRDLFGRPQPSAESAPADPYTRIEALIPPDSPLRAMRTLDEVARYVAQTILIPIDARRTHPVFGVGNPEADLMVIGEAPGAEEDRQGEPFVGPAGQLLNKMLKAIGFERADVYITNVLKSRPPYNRDPQPDEIETHLPILYKQIVLVRPRILLCVGRIAGNALLNRNSSLRTLRGKVHDFYGLPVVVTYHPAALLRNPQWKRLAWEDLQLLRAHYDRLMGMATS